MRTHVTVRVAPAILALIATLSAAMAGATPVTASTSDQGEVFTATGQVTTIGLAESVQPEIVFKGSGGSVLDTVKGQSKKATPGTWTPIIPVVGLAPTGTTGASLQLSASTLKPWRRRTSRSSGRR